MCVCEIKNTDYALNSLLVNLRYKPRKSHPEQLRLGLILEKLYKIGIFNTIALQKNVSAMQRVTFFN